MDNMTPLFLEVASSSEHLEQFFHLSQQSLCCQLWVSLALWPASQTPFTDVWINELLAYSKVGRRKGSCTRGNSGALKLKQSQSERDKRREFVSPGVSVGALAAPLNICTKLRDNPSDSWYVYRHI